MLAPAARKAIPSTALCVLSQMPVHSASAHRSSASPLLQSHMPLGSNNRKKALQNSDNKTYSGDLLEKHAIYFTEKKQCFTPQILKTSHQPFLVKYRYYNPPSRKSSSSPGKPSIKSAGINNKKREGLHRYWHQHWKLYSFVFKHIIWIITVSHCAFNLSDFQRIYLWDHILLTWLSIQLRLVYSVSYKEKMAENTAHTQKLSWLHGNETDNVFSGESLLRAKPKYSTILWEVAKVVIEKSSTQG